MLTFTCSIKTGGTWVRQLPQEIGLMHVMADDTTRDLYWCVILQFLCGLLLTTPSESVMEELLGILDPMCDDEFVHEFGATLEEEVER